MRRAIKDLCRLSDTQLFQEVAKGITFILENVERLDAAARKLSNTNDYHPAKILGGLAKEEATKVHILLDAVRCPSNRNEEKARTLGYFYDHLAKGIYARACGLQLPTFGEFSQYIDREREDCYLDGPNDVDWIVSNDITREREDDLYVGYVCDDTQEDGNGKRYWKSPRVEMMDGYYSTPTIVHIANALHGVGATTAEGLTIIAEIWRPFEPRTETTAQELSELNNRTLEALSGRKLIVTDDQEKILEIKCSRMFPLWPLDLRVRKINKAKLRKLQEDYDAGGHLPHYGD